MDAVRKAEIASRLSKYLLGSRRRFQMARDDLRHRLEMVAKVAGISPAELAAFVEELLREQLIPPFDFRQYAENVGVDEEVGGAWYR